MRAQILIPLFFFIVLLSRGQSHQWTKAIGGLENEWGFSVVADVNGDVYTAGTFSYVADFDPGPGTHTLSPIGLWDMFVTKLDANGNFIWTKQFGGNSMVWPNAIKIDSQGNICVTGNFAHYADFDPGSGTHTIASVSGFEDAFILKMDPNGNFIWVKSFGGKWQDYSNELVFDQSNNMLLCGTFRDTVDFDPGPSAFTLTSAGGNGSGFVLKLDAAGNFVWAKSIQSSHSMSGSVASDLCVDAGGNVAVTGSFSGNVDFDPGSGTYTMASVPTGFFGDSEDCFVLKLNSTGGFLWANSMGNSEADGGYSVISDLSGNFYVCGNFGGVVDFDPGSGVFNLSSNGGYDVFICSIGPTGNLNWAGSFGGNGLNYEEMISAQLQPGGDLYMTGIVTGTPDFDIGAGVYTLTAPAVDGNIFILRLTTSGTFVNAKILTGASFGHGSGISTAAGGFVYLTGYYYGTTNFDPGASNFTTTSLGRGDVFVQKLGPALGTALPGEMDAELFQVYPNPAEKELYISFEISEAEVNYQLFDQFGRVLINGVVNGSQARIDLREYPAGIYFIQLHANSMNAVKKIVVR